MLVYIRQLILLFISCALYSMVLDINFDCTRDCETGAGPGDRTKHMGR
jgi:hypothetical protein